MNIKVFGQKKDNLNFKKIHKEFVLVEDNLYAAKTEVSNKSYNIFLNFYKENDSIYNIIKPDSTLWAKGKYISILHEKTYHNNDIFDEYPIVGISYEAAIIYCNWLTEIYNQKKYRKWNKVLFKLPSEEEWEKAASGKNENNLFAWEGNNLKTEENHFKGNFYHDDDNSSQIISPVFSFYPNNLGIYNMSGNVAEMTNVKNLTKGGSWDDEVENIKIKARNIYPENETPNINVGFRVFMEVIEK